MSIKITPTMRAVARAAIEKNGLKKQDIAAEVGYSTPWVSKFLKESGENMKTISDYDCAMLQDALGVRFFGPVTKRQAEKISPIAREFGQLVDSDRDVAELTTVLQRIFRDRTITADVLAPPVDLAEFGRKLRRFAHSEPDDSKLARRAFGLLQSA